MLPISTFPSDSNEAYQLNAYSTNRDQPTNVSQSSCAHEKLELIKKHKC